MCSILQRSMLAALAIAPCLAQTPPGFEPSVSKALDVVYGTTAIRQAGITLPVSVVASPPTLALSSETPSGDYVVVMMDLSVEPNNIPTETNTTLIHWILPGLSAQGQGSTALTSHVDAIASYFPPGPPAGQTHTYALFLYREPEDFTVPAAYVPIFQNLTASVNNRVGFSLNEFVEQAGLGLPVAANWFLVSNSSASAAGSSASSSSASSGAGSTAASTGGATASSSTSESAIVKIGNVLMLVAFGVTGIWCII